MNHLVNCSSIWFSADGLASYHSSLHADLFLSLSGLCSTIHQSVNPGIPKQHDIKLSNWTNTVFHPGDGFYSRLCPTLTSHTPLKHLLRKVQSTIQSCITVSCSNRPSSSNIIHLQAVMQSSAGIQEGHLDLLVQCQLWNRGPLPAPGLNQQV